MMSVLVEPMSRNIKYQLLDCTLRDGGYNNDWEFGHDALISIVERLVNSGIDWIELGFLNEKRPFDINRSIMPNTQCMKTIYGKVDKKSSKFVGMIDYGTCDITNIQPQKETILDGIRVIFKKHLRVPALTFCKQLLDMGYTVFAQLVSITSYTEDELADLIEMANKVHPNAVSIVDTYGLLHKDNLFHYYEQLNKYLDKDITIGYHSHNNFQLAYSNSIELIRKHMPSPRHLLCDGSLFGMGKGAGNAPMELLCMYMNDNMGAHYSISQLLEAIDSNINELYSKYHWGYAMNPFIAASNDCHPNYVSYLLNKKTLSVKSVDEILKQLSEEKKLLYDKDYIEQLYLEYQKSTCNDTVVYHELQRLFMNKTVLVLGPGKTIITELPKIRTYIDHNAPYVIAVNYVPSNIVLDAVFFSNSKRYQQQITSITENQGTFALIATSNLTRTNGVFDYTVDYETLIDPDAVFPDNSMIMLIKLLARAKVRHIALAGFDGYSMTSDNYFLSKMEYDFAKRKGREINDYVNHVLPEIEKVTEIEFITTTCYRPLRKRAVLFDLDGTLLDTTEGILESVAYTAKRLGLGELDSSVLLKFIGPPIYQSFKMYYGCSEEQANKATELFRTYYKEKALYKAKLYTGIEQMLQTLQNNGIIIGVATYKREDYAISILNHFGISPYCRVMHGTDWFNKMSKTDVINKCIGELGLPPQSIVYVGDTEHDALGAQEAGIEFIAVTYGFGYKNSDATNNNSNMFFANNTNEILNCILKK